VTGFTLDTRHFDNFVGGVAGQAFGVALFVALKEIEGRGVLRSFPGSVLHLVAHLALLGSDVGVIGLAHAESDQNDQCKENPFHRLHNFFSINIQPVVQNSLFFEP
jgi:hypothetical protein